jgi:hypothetical protein
MNISELSKLDLSTIDVRKIRPEEWDAVRREVTRRAHVERAEMMRRLIKRLWSRWGDRRPRRDLGVWIYAPLPRRSRRF